MKFILNSKSLLEKLQYLSGILSTNSTIPVLDCFLFQNDNGKLKITGSDLDNTIVTTLQPDSIFVDDVNIAINGRMLIEILKAFPQQPLTFNVLDNSTVEIMAAAGNYSIAYTSGDEFPQSREIEEPKSVSINSKILSKAISKTVFATGTDDLRPVMTGVLFQMSPNGTNFVATDAHKLVKFSRTDITSNGEVDFIVPRKPLNLLKGLLDKLDIEVTIEYNEVSAKFTFEDYILMSRLIDGKYPNYEAVIPKANPNKMTIARSQFLNSVKCVSIFSDKTTHQIRLKVAGNELRISAEDTGYSNKADERLTCNYEGDDMMIGFNARLLSEVLSNTTSNEILLEMSLPERAGIITAVDGVCEEENILMMVMPVRLN